VARSLIACQTTPALGYKLLFLIGRQVTTRTHFGKSIEIEIVAWAHILALTPRKARDRKL
jgi:hypothetical protein